MLRRFRHLIYVVTAGYWLLCAYMTHAPVPAVVQPVGNDKFKHVVGYGLLATLLYWSLVAAGVRRLRVPLIVMGVLAGYAAVDELTQPAFGRTADVMDWLADVTGVMLACGVWTLVRGLAPSIGAAPDAVEETLSRPSSGD